MIYLKLYEDFENSTFDVKTKYSYKHPKTQYLMIRMISLLKYIMLKVEKVVKDMVNFFLKN